MSITSMMYCKISKNNRYFNLPKNTFELVHVKEEPKDRTNGSALNQKENQKKKSSTSINDKKKIQRSILLLYDSDYEGNEKN